MSNFPDAHKVYELAAVFRERIIEQGRSFLWPDQEIWTVENVKGAHALLARQWELGLNDYREPATLLANHSAEYLMIGADVMAAIILSTVVSRATQEPKLKTFLEAESAKNPDEKTYLLLMDQSYAAYPGSEKGYPDSWQKQYMSVLYGLQVMIEEFHDSESLPEIVLHISEALDGNEFYWALHMWALLHVMYPNEIPSVVGKGSRNLILKHYSQMLEGQEFTNDFEALNYLRSRLSQRSNSDYFDFFDLELLSDWNPHDSKVKKHLQSTRTNVSLGERGVLPNGSDRSPVYEVPKLFLERAANRGKSLLWPDAALWSQESIEDFVGAFEEMPPIEGGWLETYRDHFSKLEGNQQELLADSYALMLQFPSLDTYGAQLKRDQLDVILSMGTDERIDESTLQMVRDAFSLGIGSPGTYFSTTVHYQVAYVVFFMREYLKEPYAGIQAAADAAFRWVKANPHYSKGVGPARNILLHLLEPARFEPVASQKHKSQITARFAPLLDDETSESVVDIDEQIRLIRHILEQKHFGSRFSFYQDDVAEFWRGNRPLNDLPILGSEGTHPQETKVPTITDLATATHLDESFLGPIETLLREKQQLIFEGPPGSGKTFVAEKFARYVTGQPLDGSRNEQVELIQFHQSYSYEDFVEGIRPRTNDAGQLIYDVEPGIFRTFAERAQANPDKKFVLIIDEINRGNVSRILGELMLLLEYRDQTATLPYSKQPLTIPKNLYIIGTMNSADRSLSQIDYALRRRFYFVRFMSVEHGQADVLRGWLQARDVAHAGPVSLFVRLNERIREHMNTDDLQVGHSYFMRTDIGDPEVLDQVWKYSVMPLLREYFYHQKDREELLEGFELNRLNGLPDVPVANLEAIDVADV